MEEIRDKVVHIRLSEEEAKTVEELRQAYGFRFAADLFRYSIDHVNRKRPTLGRNFKPKAAEVEQ